jgi:glycosyltransferase involved in cell wall biosynthesis
MTTIDRIDIDQQSLRILVATHAPLSLEFGAGQMAINLGEAFTSQGHDVTLWSPCPLPPNNWSVFHFLQQIRAARKKIDAFLDGKDQFDLIDCPSIYITDRVMKSGTVIISRSVQPEILYLINDFLDVTSFTNLLKKPLHALDICCYFFYLIQGWHKVDGILCLGRLEIEWMLNKFPWLEGKLNFYPNALASNEQESLTKIRLQRQQLDQNSIDFLWIGRWASHKGNIDLINFMIERTKIRPHDSLTIAGCGHNIEKDIPSQLIESGQIKIIPTFVRQDICLLLSEHQVGLFTSKVEGWGLVLNEMLESGMTVYASPAGGVPDLQSYFPMMLRTFPPELDISIANHENCDWDQYYQRFSWRSIAENYLKIYDLLAMTNN